MKGRILKTGILIPRLILIMVTLLFLFPFYISVLMSLKNQKETAANMMAWPVHICWYNFTEAIERANIFSSMQNSIIVTITSVLLVIFVASMAGYGIARMYHNRWFKLYETMLMAAMMIPFQTLMIPLYKIFKSLGLMNTLAGAVLLIGASNVPFAVMLIIGFVKTLPIELEEAALIDGCGKFGIFWKIILPLLKPIIATVAILDALWTWNEFNISLLLLQKNNVKTLPLQQYVFFGEHSANHNMAFAAAVVAMIPIVIFFIFAQGKIVEGMTVGAVKG